MPADTLACCGYDISHAANARVMCFHEIHTTEKIIGEVFSQTLNRLRELNKCPPKSFILLHSQSYQTMEFPGQRVNLDIVLPEKQIMFLGAVASKRCALALRQICLDDIDSYIKYIEADVYDLRKFIGKNKAYKSRQAIIRYLQNERRRRERMKKNSFLNLRQGFFMPVCQEQLSNPVIEGAWQRFCREFKLSELALLPVHFLKEEKPETAKKIIAILADLSKKMAKKQNSEEIARILRAEILGILGLVHTEPTNG